MGNEGGLGGTMRAYSVLLKARGATKPRAQDNVYIQIRPTAKRFDCDIIRNAMRSVGPSAMRDGRE